ncbi:MAG: uL30 family ribosomal protein [Candidatus Marsarchaeota archaeon]|jgi:large subunit ribosomal protein L30|nr:uL30 family ribosomal protein [Candidatus Marsarchaeota archaeon]
MKANLENKLIAIVRVRGRVGVRRNITETLNRMNLKRVNNMVLLYGSKSNLGMLNKCNNFITYGEANEETLEKLFSKRGIKISKEDLNALATGKKSMKEVTGEVPLRMHPPRHGYEGTKIGFNAGGALGYRGEKINELIKRMS